MLRPLRLALASLAFLVPAPSWGGPGVAPISGADMDALPGPEDQFRWSVAEKTVAHRHFDLLFPSETIASGDHVLPLVKADKPISIGFDYDGRRLTIADYFARSNATGLLVLKGDRILFERYARGNGPDTHWASRSMAKSVTATLIGIALKEGKIHSLDDAVERYVPELADTRYGPVTLRQTLQMTSGMPDTEFPSALPLQACTVKRERGCFIRELKAIAAVDRPDYAKPGTRFSYLSADVIVNGLVLERATGMSPAQYLSSRIWRPFGMERDAYWNLEAEGGATFANSGIGATLRDYGRFGLFVMQGGRLGDGDMLLPADWAKDALTPSRASVIAGTPYGFNWWLNPPKSDAPGISHTYYARGSNGQLIVINPDERLVIVKWAVWDNDPAKPSGATAKDMDDALFDAIIKAAHGR